MEQTDLDRQGEPAPCTALVLDGDGSAEGARGTAGTAGTAATAGTAGSDDPRPARSRWVRALIRRPVAVHLAVLIGFIAAGVAVTWPLATNLTGRLPASRDSGSYVWGFWWVAPPGEPLGN